MSQASEELTHTPLEAEHRALGARLGPFAGWLMPIEYEGTLSEHRAVREAVGLFDLTHLGRIIVENAGAFDLLQRVVTNDLRKVEAGGAQYNMVLNERGGIVDDLIVYRVAPDRFLLVPNAANARRVHQILLDLSDGPTDIILWEDACIIAPQGPRSVDLVGRVIPETTRLEYMHCMPASFGHESILVSRSGYTGERGFELFVQERLAEELWRELVDEGRALDVRPCGLGSRDTLRLEMGYPLHGNDISEERTPLEAGLSWAVAFDKGDFLGRDALVRQKEEGIPSRLWGLRMEGKLIPRPHYPVFADGDEVGTTTSGTFSPTLKVGIAMAYLSPRDRFSPGQKLGVDVRGRRGGAEVVKPPFVPSTPK
jgi:aminomethyltransferase